MQNKLLIIGACLFSLLAAGAHAAVLITIHKQLPQHMVVLVDGEMQYDWPVSTGRVGYSTPSGTFVPLRLVANYHSHRYHHAPMPHSIFITDGIAIHGSSHVLQLGRKDSHGCIHLSPENAATLFGLVTEQQGDNEEVKIEITDD